MQNARVFKKKRIFRKERTEMNEDIRSGMVPAVSITGLSKSYGSAGSQKALDQVTLSVAQGEFFGLLGPNGAGKSTLISALAGTLSPDAGQISVLGKDLKSDARYCRMALGIVPQEVSFDPFFTVSETLRLQSGFFGLRHNGEWIETVLERLGLSEKKNERVMSLSGGMRRRVLIAQALVHRPPVIILDEPTAGVDIELRQKLWSFMQELNKAGHTVILTTHYLEEAEQLCSRIALLNRGRVAALGSTEELLHRFSGDRLKFRFVSGTLPAAVAAAAEKMSDGRLSVKLGHPDSLPRLFRELNEAGAVITDVETGKASLEEVFLKVMNHAE